MNRPEIRPPCHGRTGAGAAVWDCVLVGVLVAQLVDLASIPLLAPGLIRSEGAPGSDFRGVQKSLGASWRLLELRWCLAGWFAATH